MNPEGMLHLLETGSPYAIILGICVYFFIENKSNKSALKELEKKELKEKDDLILSQKTSIDGILSKIADGLESIGRRLEKNG